MRHGPVSARRHPSCATVVRPPAHVRVRRSDPAPTGSESAASPSCPRAGRAADRVLDSTPAAASPPTSSSSRTAISPSVRCAQPPTIRPSHHTVGPMLPDRSNSAGPCGRGTSAGPTNPWAWGRGQEAAPPTGAGEHRVDVVGQHEPASSPRSTSTASELGNRLLRLRRASSRSTSADRRGAPGRTRQATVGRAPPGGLGRALEPAGQPDLQRRPAHRLEVHETARPPAHDAARQRPAGTGRGW